MPNIELLGIQRSCKCGNQEFFSFLLQDRGQICVGTVICCRCRRYAESMSSGLVDPDFEGRVIRALKLAAANWNSNLIRTKDQEPILGCHL